MSSKIRNVALLLPAFVLATGLASAQGVKVTTVTNGAASTTTLTNDSSSGPTAKAPAVDANGLAKYWDGLGTGGASTNYFSVPPYITAPPNPQIAVGPDDILTIVNRTISRFPNPNAAGNTGVANPYNNPPTEYVWLDAWIGIPTLGPILCPSGTGSNTTCVIDNASVRYDQLQGRFVVLFTVTDVPAHRSNFVLIVSRFSQFTKCAANVPTCVPNGASSPLFTPPVIAPIVGGTQTGGVNGSNWVMYTIPINLSYTLSPTAAGNGVVGVTSTYSTGGGTATNVTSTDCGTVGGPPTATNGALTAPRSCTNYYPTGARMGLDNDNILLTAPVLDQGFATNEGNFPSFNGQQQGPYAGTRVVSVSKMVVYNGTALTFNQPPACIGNNPIDCMAVNLADNVVTGTITARAGCATGTAPPTVIVDCSPTSQVIAGAVPPARTQTTPLPPIFFEPDNLRGRALSSFDSQVSPFGVITPVDYLVGTAITDSYGAVPTSPANSALVLNGNQYFIQTVVYSCPGTAIFPGPAGVAFCGMAQGAQIPDLPVVGPLRTNVQTLANVTDPSPVGQGFSATQMTTNPLNTPVSPTTNNRLFVGDDRPQQVIFREGLLYVARTVRLYDATGTVPGLNALGTSTVLYDLIKTCATAAAQPNCGGYSVGGTTFGAPALALETEWFNGTNVPDPTGNITGFGFYQPMFESPADVISSGPVSPISLLPWFDKLFVGMTTGGTSNVANTFSKNFPSLWDFRPGDDAYDTATPYLDPYTGVVRNQVVCGNDISVLATVTRNSATVVVNDTTGLAVGMFLNNANVVTPTTITAINPATNTVTLSNPYTGASSTLPLTTGLTFSRTPTGVTTTVTLTTPTVGAAIAPPFNTVTVASATGLQIGQSVGATATTSKTATTVAANQSILLNNTTSVAVGEVVTGGTATASVTTVTGSTTIQVPTATQVAIGETVTGTGIQAATTVTAITVNPDASLQVTLSLPLTATTALGSTITATFNAAPAFAAGTVVSSPPDISNRVNVTPAPTITSFVGTNPLTGLPISNGLPATFTAGGFFPAGTIITAINGTTVTLSANAVAPAGVPPNTVLNNIPITFLTSGSIAAVTCPMIQWSSRGGASTDPNDGSLWLFGEFAKNRLSTIPGPGQWGTSVANYALSLPAVDPYNNDNTYFQDVQPGNVFFTWIQIAKNLGIAVPSATGPCVTNNGGTPLQNPPVAGTTPNPSPSSLVCPYFNPTATVSRAEMAYWVVRSQMDEPQVTAYLNATGGDPTGAGGLAGAGSFSDYSSVTNPFLASSVTTNQLIRYIEVMYRRGYTKGCSSTNDPLRRYCPNDLVTRAQMSVFLIRAKMNNVFPTTLSGIPVTGPYGDNFGLFQTSPSYFSDVTSGATDPFKDYYIYVQKMRELRITNGTSGSLFSPGNNLTRQEIATFVVRAFFL